MPLYLGSQKIKELYVGDKKIKEAWLKPSEWETIQKVYDGSTPGPQTGAFNAWGETWQQVVDRAPDSYKNNDIYTAGLYPDYETCIGREQITTIHLLQANKKTQQTPSVSYNFFAVLAGYQTGFDAQYTPIIETEIHLAFNADPNGDVLVFKGYPTWGNQAYIIHCQGDESEAVTYGYTDDRTAQPIVEVPKTRQQAEKGINDWLKQMGYVPVETHPRDTPIYQTALLYPGQVYQDFSFIIEYSSAPGYIADLSTLGDITTPFGQNPKSKYTYLKSVENIQTVVSQPWFTGDEIYSWSGGIENQGSVSLGHIFKIFPSDSPARIGISWNNMGVEHTYSMDLEYLGSIDPQDKLDSWEMAQAANEQVKRLGGWSGILAQGTNTNVKGFISNICATTLDDDEGDYRRGRDPLASFNLGGSLFEFDVQDNEGTNNFIMPLAGTNGGSAIYRPYNWRINWGDGLTETVSGTSSANNFSVYHNFRGSSKKHRIKITPVSSATGGWFDAFGSSNAYVELASHDAYKVKKIYRRLVGSSMRTLGVACCSFLCSGFINLEDIPYNFLPENFEVPEQAFQLAFNECRKLPRTGFSSSQLPSVLIGNYCFYGMYMACHSLGKLPAYQDFFKSAAPTEGCYERMFTNCISLSYPGDRLCPTNTVLSYHCFSQTFFGCENLRVLENNFFPTATQTNYAYSDMFGYCANLRDIGNANLAWFNARTPCGGMFLGCTNIVTPITYNQIPAAWK
jgi:hypothetical protein